MKIENYQIITVAEQPQLAEQIEETIATVWPTYILEAASSGYSKYRPDWYGIYRRWPQFQFALFDQAQEIVATANALAFFWDSDEEELPKEGWDWVMDLAQRDFEAGKRPTTLSALSITIPREMRGKGLSYVAIRAMKRLAIDASLRWMIAPVRPTQKSLYPLQPITEYMNWRREDGMYLDPWLRVHHRLGGRVIGACTESMTMGGKVSDWERWLGIPLPATGLYTHPELLIPLQIDRHKDRGIYQEPNVWMTHPLDSGD